jgi:hypothetical protein
MREDIATIRTAIRDAVQRLVTASCKLNFPYVTNHAIGPELFRERHDNELRENALVIMISPERYAMCNKSLVTKVRTCI